ncbi:transcriptional repressor LexA [Crocosphaera watsonii]|uniref:LexA repressor n=2 Tax=Crocosphaera watsonii TaxID=263511 RepID=G5J2P1_CROWT|nr:transcriptional repressor LexA [Crocosphaera watsonii]EHJ13542.1 SOS-response repressor and protease LexA [Crocosphaera watsonii WH 0003]CCQ54160.1 SOS-response repressor and protease LexA [Crocosphaera watsonii WH 0005]
MEPLTPAQKELYEWLIKYIDENQHAPSIRQMMKAMNLRSPAPVQSRLERLRNKGYIDWIEGKARTLRILHYQSRGIPILGAIAAGGLVEPFVDEQERLDLSHLLHGSSYWGLRVTGDSMIEDLITDGDLAIMRSLDPDETLKKGEIVAARVEGVGTTLKRYYQEGEMVMLKPSNLNYQPIELNANQIQVQGILIGVWRGY